LNSKSPIGWIKNMSSIYTWSNREIEWYMAEERLLFSCLTDEECDRWVCMLNWVVSKKK
jgi:hypothetical protein